MHTLIVIEDNGDNVAVSCSCGIQFNADAYGGNSAPEPGTLTMKPTCPLGRLEEEIKAALDSYPKAIRVREGGGPENLAASLTVTFARVKDKATKARAALRTDGTSDNAARFMMRRACDILANLI